MTRLWGSTPGRCKRLCPLHKVQTGSDTHPTSYSIAIGAETDIAWERVQLHLYPPPTHSFTAWTGTPLPLPLYNNNFLQAMCATSGRLAVSATSMDATDLTCSLPTWTVGSGQVQAPRSDRQHSAPPVTGVTQAASDNLSPTTVKLRRYKSATQAIYWLSSSGKARLTACHLHLPVHTLYLLKNKEF